jgi:hypothetical protein
MQYHLESGDDRLCASLLSGRAQAQLEMVNYREHVEEYLPVGLTHGILSVPVHPFPVVVEIGLESSQAILENPGSGFQREGRGSAGLIG